jgi:hypothetical protein
VRDFGNEAVVIGVQSLLTMSGVGTIRIQFFGRYNGYLISKQLLARYGQLTNLERSLGLICCGGGSPTSNKQLHRISTSGLSVR